MRIVVIGGTGLIGSKVVMALTRGGHDVVAASPKSGVDSVTGVGLDDAIAGAQVVVDLSNSPSFEDAAVLEFFTTGTINLMKVEVRANVGHHVALSVVNSDLIPGSGYLRAKAAQERLIRKCDVPYSIVRATQFFEFSRGIAQASTVDGIVRLPPVRYRPIAADDVARMVSRVACQAPLNNVLNIAGPTEYQFDQFIAQTLAAQGEPHQVIADVQARYFGAELEDRSLVPGDDAHLGAISHEQWLADAQMV